MMGCDQIPDKLCEVGNLITGTNNKATKIINLETGTTIPSPLPSHLSVESNFAQKFPKKRTKDLNWLMYFG